MRYYGIFDQGNKDASIESAGIPVLALGGKGTPFDFGLPCVYSFMLGVAHSWRPPTKSMLFASFDKSD